MMREAILRVLADHAERSITDVLDALPPSADLAHTRRLLRELAEEGTILQRKQGRVALYRMSGAPVGGPRGAKLDEATRARLIAAHDSDENTAAIAARFGLSLAACVAVWRAAGLSHRQQAKSLTTTVQRIEACARSCKRCHQRDVPLRYAPGNARRRGFYCGRCAP